jgi:hypothetical protein
MVGGRADTSWQQGFVLSSASAAKLGLAPDQDGSTVVVLVSHDCDLLEPSTSDPNCEVIVGRKIDSIDGLYTNGKNPRRLHLPFSAGTTKISLEMLAANKKFVSKDAVLDEPIVSEIKLSQDEHFTLQSWLSSRYHRPIFPDEFDRRLKARPAEVHKKIANAIKVAKTDVIAVLFDLDAGKDQEHGQDDPYSLEILIVYNVSEDPGRALASATKAASTIKALFRQYYFSNGQWNNIELRQCHPVSADALSLHVFRSTKPWNFDYLEILGES